MFSRPQAGTAHRCDASTVKLFDGALAVGVPVGKPLPSYSYLGCDLTPSGAGTSYIAQIALMTL